MFTRMLVGLDGSPQADVALDQAMLLAPGFRARILLAHVREKTAAEAADWLEHARGRVAAAGLPVDVAERHGEPHLELPALARETDVALIGRTGRVTASGSVGPTAAAMLRAAEVCVIVCASRPSSMRSVVVVFDRRVESRRALELAARFASIVESTVHLVHASDDRAEGLRAVGEAEALLSLQQVAYQTHVEPGRAADAALRVMERVRGDALFAGAHMARGPASRSGRVLASEAEEILRRCDVPVVIQP